METESEQLFVSCRHIPRVDFSPLRCAWFISREVCPEKNSACAGLWHLEEILSQLQHSGGSGRAVQQEGRTWGVRGIQIQVLQRPTSVPTQVPQEEMGTDFTRPKSWVLVSHCASTEQNCCLALVQPIPAACSRIQPLCELSPSPNSFLWQDWSCLQEKWSLC